MWPLPDNLSCHRIGLLQELFYLYLVNLLRPSGAAPLPLFTFSGAETAAWAHELQRLISSSASVQMHLDWAACLSWMYQPYTHALSLICGCVFSTQAIQHEQLLSGPFKTLLWQQGNWCQKVKLECQIHSDWFSSLYVEGSRFLFSITANIDQAEYW